MRATGRRPRRGLITAVTTVGAAAIALNVLAYRHARALTRFAAAGTTTPKPESLSLPQKLGALVAGPVVRRPENRRTPSALGLAWERRAFASIDGLALEAWLIPAEPARGLVVMFHGYVDSKASLLREAQELHQLGWSCLLVDFRGSGGSAGDVTTLGFYESNDVAASYELARGLVGSGRLVLFGASMGAVAVLKAVAERSLPADALLLEAPFDRLLTVVGHRCRTAGLTAFPAAELLVFWGGWQQGFDGFRHNPVDYAAAVDRPVLLMQGDLDDHVSLDEQRALFRRLRGPKEMKVFHGLGHGPLLRERPAEWRAAVSAFLDRLGA